jgi:D-alanyl-D-alanine dipeptidase
MTLLEKIERSKYTSSTDFSTIVCVEMADALVTIQASEKIMVKPIWQLSNSLEGELYSQYMQHHPEYCQLYIRANVLQRLRTAANALPDNLNVVVRAGHRPIEVQKKLLQRVLEAYRLKYPDVTYEQAVAYARVYVSDPAIKVPPHCCGSAVDVELYDTELKQVLDYGSPLNTNDESSYLHNPFITTIQKEHRLLLLRTMLNAGFASYYAEWWHYSYGDEMWAWFYQQPESLYGLIER